MEEFMRYYATTDKTKQLILAIREELQKTERPQLFQREVFYLELPKNIKETL